ncbi:hypothetical protein CRG98_030350 [Punica granatum]|uniref:Uncharacterized protein n=1 Tax=Punica granatum TaxID=22663 RepID=A0A2I0IZ15_PUNGR|nr:hypothetical protein CRG98_030350 [Punica granatum]
MDFIKTRLAVRKETALLEASNSILLQGRWFPTPKRPLEVAVVVIWFKCCRVDPYSPAKITENRARLGNKPDWAVLGSDVTTVVPDGILVQGRWLHTPKRPPVVTVVVVWRKEIRVDPNRKKKKTAQNGQTRLAGMTRLEHPRKNLVFRWVQDFK